MSTVTCQHCAFEAPAARTYCPECKKKLRPATVTAAAPPELPALPAPPRQDFETRLQQIAANADPYAHVPSRTTGARTVRPVLAGFTIAALVGVAVTLVLLLVAHTHRADLVHQMKVSPRSVSLDAARHADDDVQNAAIAYLLMLVVTAALFITWLFQLTKVVDDYSPDALRHRPGWAIGGWFVPILNLVRPKQMVDDVWTGSSPEWSHERPAFYVHLWWAAFLISGLLDRIAAQRGDNSLSDVESSDRMFRWAEGLELLAAVLAIVVVVTTTRRVLRVVRPASPHTPVSG